MKVLFCNCHFRGLNVTRIKKINPNAIIIIFFLCIQHNAYKIIYCVGPPPPPRQWILIRVHSESFNTTHYPVLFTWSHPHQNNNTSSPITYYILKLDRNIEQGFSEIIIVDNDVSNITLWYEFNTMYNVSLQSENCGSLWRSLPQFKEVYQSAPNISSMPDLLF